MARMIDVNDVYSLFDKDGFARLHVADIDTIPSVDAVEVVRCRECKQGEIDDPDFPDQYYCHAGCGWNNGGFYCAHGERKEGAE